MRRMLAGLLLFVGLPALADVTIEVTPFAVRDPSAGEYTVILKGDAAPVTLTLGSLDLDWCKPGGVDDPIATPTQPNLGVPNGDGVSSRSVVLTGPVVTICDIDPNDGWPGMRATVGGVTKDVTLGAVVSFSSSAPAPTPAPSPPPSTTFGSSTLTWVAPTTNTDGSPLTDLAGYRVYWGTAVGAYPSSQSVGNVLTYVVQGLAPGTWYFVVTALNTAGRESATSNVASKVIPDSTPMPTDPCVLRPFTFTVNTWPGGITGSRSLGFSSNKAVDRFDLTRVSTRVTGVRATDLEGCVVTVTR